MDYSPLCPGIVVKPIEMMIKKGKRKSCRNALFLKGRERELGSDFGIG